nr:rho GDP-dissociation inhibitor 1 [Vicugna pacos]
MAEQEPTAEQLAQIAAENEEDEHSVNYKPPAQKSIQEIQELDKDDESLRKYKEALLGRVAVSADPNVPNVVVTRLTLVCSSAPGPLELDLTGDLESFKKQSFVLKEGVEYRIKISFRVNREIVSGMKYIQHTYRKGVKIDKTDYMVGSYGPRAEEYEFLTPMEEAPKGMLARGSYNIKSRFTDDDRTDHLGQCLEPPDPPESPRRIQPAAEPYSSHLGLPAWSRVPGLQDFALALPLVKDDTRWHLLDLHDVSLRSQV